MAIERATGIETTGTPRDASPERLQRLEERVDGLESHLNDCEDEISSLESTVEQQEETINEQTKTIDEQDEKIDELEDQLNHGEKKDGYLTDDIVDIETQLAELSRSDTATANGGEHSEAANNMLPIERVSRLEATETEIEVTPSIERAVTIFKHWSEWSTKTQKGRVLKENQKTLLRTATGEKLSWRQVYRACEALQRLSKNQMRFKQHKKHGWMLIEANPTARSHCQSSSATPA